MHKRLVIIFSSFFLALISLGFLNFKSVSIEKPPTLSKTNNVDEDNWVKEKMEALSLEGKIAQSLFISCWSNRGEDHLTETATEIRENQLGGVLFFQGETQNLSLAQELFNSEVQIPLIYSIDGEWGTAMRIHGEKRYPYAQTLGVIDSLPLTEKLTEYMAIEMSQQNIHLNFAPVADVNVKVENPVIGYRSFGSDPAKVSQHVAASVRAQEKEGVLSCVKHFPGHGDTDMDSHFELPTVNHTKEEFEKTDFLPFKAAIKENVSAVMMAHLNVPKLDPSGLPSSLSKNVIQIILRKQLNFSGLIISDALDMKAVSDKYGKAEVMAMAYAAGCDILLCPGDIKGGIALIVKKIKNNEISIEEVNQHCERILRAKYKVILTKKTVKRASFEAEKNFALKQVYEKSIVVLKNDSVLPLNNLADHIVRITVGVNADAYKQMADFYAPTENHHFFSVQEAINRLKNYEFDKKATYVLDFHSSTQRKVDNYGFEEWQKVVDLIPEEASCALVFFGNPLFLNKESSFPVSADAVVINYENHELAQKTGAEMVYGALSSSNKLIYGINDVWKKGEGKEIKSNGRLKYTVPEEVGIDPEKLKEIDDIMENAISAKALPGGQIVAAVDGKVFFRKAYGTTKYENGQIVDLNNIYDLASVTKIAASTFALMKLTSEGKLNETQRMGDILPEKTVGTSLENCRVIDLLTHRAGLVAWIPFYVKTLENGKPSEKWYRNKKEVGFSVPVAENLWIRDDYPDTILKRIGETPLGTYGRFEYSDLSYYFFMKYIQKITGKPMNLYVQEELYKSLGLRNLCYNPLERFAKNQIVPTENDKEFRRQVIQGNVHDPGAAMMGGVCGHAGLFGTATDLASVMQLFLNQGQIGKYALLKKDVVKNWTSYQFKGNRRGIGFDKPGFGSAGPTYDGCSGETFGHTGFTGICAWADPVHKINFVFVSNRVYPNADNKKITNMSVRTEIQRVIYQAVLARKK